MEVRMYLEEMVPTQGRIDLKANPVKASLDLHFIYTFRLQSVY